MECSEIENTLRSLHPCLPEGRSAVKIYSTLNLIVFSAEFPKTSTDLIESV